MGTVPVSTACDRAKLACDGIKSSYSSCYNYYSPEIQNDTERKQYTAIIYNHIAHALARGYTDLFYVNMDTNELIEFHTDDEHGVLSEVRHSADFFEGCERDAKTGVHPDDQEKFIQAMNRDFLKKALEGNKVFEMTYRRIKDGDPFYVLMKVSRMEDDERLIVIAVQDIDEQVRHRKEEERIQEERTVYARLQAITGNYIVIYVVDPETSHYREFSATSGYAEAFGTEKKGDDFFDSVRRDARIFAHPGDIDRFLQVFYKKDLERLSYQASHDELTGLYNRFGYDFIISEMELSTTYLLMVDVDDFKTINDNYGHEVGDKVLIKIADTLRTNFRSDDCVCRIGGDEFVVVMVQAHTGLRALVKSKIEKINRELADSSDGLPPG